MKFQFEIGDVILFRRGGKQGNLIGRFVRLITGSEFTHCGMVVQDYNGEFFVAEQDNGSGHLTHINKFYMIRRVKPEQLAVYRRKNIFMPQSSFLLVFDALKKGYGYANLFDALINHGIGLFIEHFRYRPFLSKFTSSYTCAGYIAKQYMELVGGKLPYDFPNWKVAEPDDFANGEFIKVAEGVDIWSDNGTEN